MAAGASGSFPGAGRVRWLHRLAGGSRVKAAVRETAMDAKIATIVLMCAIAPLSGCSRQQDSAANQADSKPPEMVTAEDEGVPCTHVGTDAAYREWQEIQQAAKAGPEATVANELVVEGSGSYRWNDAPVDSTRLRQFLDVVHTMAPTPWLIVRRGPAADEAAVEAAREAIYLGLDCRAEF